MMGVLGAELLNDVSKVNIEIGLPANFLIELKDNDDWSFIIKTHAYLEALLSHAISEAVHRKELSDVLCKLDMANTQFGKVILSEKLGLIKSDGKKFLLKLNKLRNFIAHNVQQIKFEFSSYLKTLDKNQKTEFINAFSYFACDEDMRDHREIVVDLILNNTKITLWLCAMHFTSIIWWKKELEKLQTTVYALNKQSMGRAIANQGIDRDS